jgi:D-3-phosphoglycerate dehydrogenase
MLSEAGHLVDDPGVGEFSEAEMTQLVRDADALLIGPNRITLETMEAAPRLKVISKGGVGVDNIDLTAATRLGIPVCNTPGSNKDSVADHAIGMMLALLRNLISLNAATHRGEGWPLRSRIGGQLTGRTLAVIGTGNIGRAVMLRAAQGFGMTILGYDEYPSEEAVDKYGCNYGSLEEILPRADVVTIHLPLTQETRGLISKRELGMMKKTALLIICARGGIVDEKELADALRNGQIAGAGVDVYEEEPPVASPLFGVDNALLTPHLAGISPEASIRGRLMSAENILGAFEGRPVNLVNPEVLSSPVLRIPETAI